MILIYKFIFGSLFGGQVIPFTGALHPPIGYYLPEGRYSIQMRAFLDSMVSFSVFMDSLVYHYSRSDADSTQNDYLDYGNGLSISNNDHQAKTIGIQTINTISSSAKQHEIKVSMFRIPTNDSVRFQVNDENNLALFHTGSKTSYTISLSSYSDSSVQLFSHQNIVLDSNSSHNIVPLWDSLETNQLTIYIDHGNQGHFTDSIIVTNEITGIVGNQDKALPKEIALYQNYPNPFNPLTNFEFALPHSNYTTLRIFNLLGEEIATLISQELVAGKYSIPWNANGLPSGVYFYRLQVGNHIETKKLLLLR